MNKVIFIGDKTFKQFRDTEYYLDEDGTVYSGYSKKILKWLYRKSSSADENKKYAYIDINVGGGKQKHVSIHRLVYETWLGEIPAGYQVNHKDDDSLNNNINNLYLGSQKENIRDCVKNNHRSGNCWVLTVFDNEVSQTKTFCPAFDFIEYSGHPCQNQCLNRMFSRNWFKKRFTIIDYHLCKNNFEKKSVTTIPDECKEVG